MSAEKASRTIEVPNWLTRRVIVSGMAGFLAVTAGAGALAERVISGSNISRPPAEALPPRSLTYMQQVALITRELNTEPSRAVTVKLDETVLNVLNTPPPPNELLDPVELNGQYEANLWMKNGVAHVFVFPRNLITHAKDVAPETITAEIEVTGNRAEPASLYIEQLSPSNEVPESQNPHINW